MHHAKDTGSRIGVRDDGGWFRCGGLGEPIIRRAGECRYPDFRSALS